MTTKITTDLKIKYLQQLELECGIANGQLFEGVDVAKIRSEILIDMLSRQVIAQDISAQEATNLFNRLNNELWRSDEIVKPRKGLFSMWKNWFKRS